MPFSTMKKHDVRISFVIRANMPDANMSALCREYGINRGTGYKWLERYRQGGSLQAVREQSRRPHHSPGKISSVIEEQLVALRQEYDWGARKILVLLSRSGVSCLPSESTVNRVFKRRGLVPPSESHPPAIRRFERSHCNELWQMDFKGEYHMGAGWCYPLSILDDHSRFLIGLHALPNQRTAGVYQSLVQTFERYGVPEAMLMDHGIPWWSTSNEQGLTRLAVGLINQGIRLLFSRVRHPQTQGKVERFHRTLNKKIRRYALPESISGFQKRMDDFAQEYNQVRPHEALAMVTPTERYQPSSKMYQPNPPEWQYPSGATVVKLNHRGYANHRGYRYFVSEALAGQYVRIERFDNKLVVRYRHMYVREINEKTRRTVTLLQPADKSKVYTMS